MTIPPQAAATDYIIRQGRALVRAIEGLTEIAPTGPIERFVVGLLLTSYKGRLRAVDCSRCKRIVEDAARGLRRRQQHRAHA